MNAGRENVGERRAQRRILVLGGSGVTGNRIAARLLEIDPAAEIVIASRKQAPRPAEAGKPAARRLDALASDAPAQLKEFELVILALGPFDRLGTRVHRACIEAGVDCLDINDAPGLLPEILALDGAARERGVCVATGMGLCPGLTSLFLMERARAARGIPADLCVALWLGGDQEVGRAAVETMLSGFTPSVWEIREGQAQEVAANDAELPRLRFPAIGRDVPVFHLPVAEAFTLSRAVGDGPKIQRLDLRAHFEGMSPLLVALLRSELGRSRAIQRALRRLVSAIQPFARRLGQMRDESLLWVFERRAPYEHAVVARGLSSYDMTACFAARVAALMVDGARRPRSGVVSAEDLFPHAPELLAGLCDDGLRIQRVGRWASAGAAGDEAPALAAMAGDGRSS